MQPIHAIYSGVSPKILFLLWSIYDCLILWIPCPIVMITKLGDRGDKIMQIPNMTVNLLSEHFLTMNL